MNNQTSLGKLILIAVGLFVVVGGGAMTVHSFLQGLDDKDEQISRARTELDSLDLKVRMLQKKKVEYTKWQTLSLPPDLTVANNRYSSFLKSLAMKHTLAIKKTSEGASTVVGGKNSNLTPLSFQMTVEGTFPKLLAFLQDFYSHNLPHQIRTCTIKPLAAGADGKLEVSFNIEAAVLPGATPRQFLPAMPDKRVWALEVLAGMSGTPAGLALAPSLLTPTGVFGGRKLAQQAGQQRDYKKLVDKNVFAGLINPDSVKPNLPVASAPDKDSLKFVQLISITSSGSATEAQLRNRVTNKFTKLRADRGRSDFEIRDENNHLLLKGRVVSINPREVVFQVDGKNYTLGMGQFLADALKQGQPSPVETKADTKPHETPMSVEDDS